MKLSRTVSYAVQATMQLAETDSDSPVPCSQLASQGDMPERFLLQILRNLVTSGILKSTRGVEGGYSLTRPAEQISLLEVIEAIDGPLGSNVELRKGVSHDELQRALEEVATPSRRQLSAIKLSRLVVGSSSGPESLKTIGVDSQQNNV